MHIPYLRHLREIADGSRHAPAMKPECRPPTAFGLSTQLLALHTYSRYSRSSCLFRCHCQHNCYPLYNRCARSGCPSWLSFISVIFQAHLGASWLPEKSSCTKILLTVHMRPVAIALNYSVKNVRNDARQIYMQCNSLVWGSLTLVPIIDTLGALQEQIFSATAQSLYSKRSGIRRRK